jgi:phosphoenolpyruvate carboxylase
VFGFHLAVLDLRQNSDVHEAVVAELLARAGVTADYSALGESERVDVLARELAGHGFSRRRISTIRRASLPSLRSCVPRPTFTCATARRHCRTM